MDDVLEENLERHALKEQRDMAAKYRNIGIGIMGLADALVKLGVVYGSKEAVTITRTIMQKIFIFAVDASVELAEERGSFPGYSPRVWDSEIINNAFDNEKVNEFRLTNKLRNCSLISIAPTGSIGTMFNVSTGCEPFFALSYNRRTVSLNKEETTYSVDIKAVDEYRKITGNMGELPPEFITSSQIPWKRRIDMQAALQKFTDTAISSTVNLPKETTVESIKSLYRYAYESGLKGVTIYRDGSRDPILSTSDNKEVSEELSVNTENAKALVEDSHSLKRGEIIKSGNNWIGIKRTLTTGCGTLHVQTFWDPSSGELREIYLSKGSTGGCNNFMISLSRMISLAARGGVGVDAILDQLKSCGVCPSYAVRSAIAKDTSKGSSCPVAIGNALKDMSKEISDIICNCQNKEVQVEKVQPEDTESTYEECPSCHEKTLVHLGGCIGCTNCGYSKCN